MKSARKTVRRTRKTSGSPPKPEVIVVPADCSVRNISALQRSLAAIPESVRNITLDLQPLQRFDSSTLQLVAAFTRDLRARGTQLLTCGTPAGWDDTAALLGLTAILTDGG